MQKLKSILALATVIALATTSLTAQQKRISPHETISKPIDKCRVTIVYGRPYTKDPKSGEPRKVWGELVPFGEVWRLGADESTLLTTEKTIELGGLEVPPGAYALFMLPAADGSAKLIVSKTVGQWGAFTYKESSDLGRVELTKADAAAPVDQFTMSIDKNPAGGGIIKLAWEKTEYSVGFKVKS